MKNNVTAKLAAIGLAALCVYVYMVMGAPSKKIEEASPSVTVAPPTENVDGAITVSKQQIILTPVPTAESSETVIEATITGGLEVKNETRYSIDTSAVINGGTDIRLEPELPQILIIHTHSSEAYTPSGLDRYESTDTCRTQDKNYNIIRIGDELEKIYTDSGLCIIHDREIYDYPSYTGSYTRCGEAIENYLTEYPSIKIVIDMHRDAIGSDGVVYKTVAEEDGTCASQVMLLVGTDDSGLEHPNWRSNLSLAFYLQNSVNNSYPTLMRPLNIVAQRYNQQLSGGSLILEVGSNGNTLQEALAAIRLFGKATAPALLMLIE